MQANTKQDTRAFHSEREVSEWFLQVSSPPINERCQKLLDVGITVDTKLRKEIMCGGNRGNVVIHGTVHSYVFKNLKGGVWHVTLGPLNK